MMNKEFIEKRSTLFYESVQKPWTIVTMKFCYNGYEFYGSGAAKWSTQDQTTVKEAKKTMKLLGSKEFSGLSPSIRKLIVKVAPSQQQLQQDTKYDWNPELGLEIARGRAIDDIVRQVDKYLPIFERPNAPLFVATWDAGTL
jgi:hypothetical protein